jgi:hypothetical protein
MQRLSSTLATLIALLLLLSRSSLDAQAQQKPPAQPAPVQKRPSETPPPDSYLNARLVAFCRARLGQTVGSGECTDLIEQCMAAIGAHRRMPDYPNAGDYVWGAFVCSLEAVGGQHVSHFGSTGDNGRVVPGDIIQFRDARFEGATRNGTYWRSMDHHTAVVERVSDDGSYCQVLEQNADGKRYVLETTLTIPDLRRGWLRVYRPLDLKGELPGTAVPQTTDPAPDPDNEPAPSTAEPKPPVKSPKRKPARPKPKKATKHRAAKPARPAGS